MYAFKREGFCKIISKSVSFLEGYNQRWRPAKWRVTMSGELRFMTSYLES